MIFNRKAHRRIRLQNVVFTILFLAVIGLLAWLSTRYSAQSDWTASGRNTLSETSQVLLSKMQQPIEITAYVAQNETLRVQITDLVQKYQHYKPDVQLSFVNPDTRPDLAREQGITVEGEMLVRYDMRKEQIKIPSENELSNALQRLTHQREPRLVFLSGHGERDPLGQANHDLGIFGQQLASKGFKLNTLNLVENPGIPNNTAVLVIADPQTALLDGEIKIIEEFIDQGGHLLWLHEPGNPQTLDVIQQDFGIEFLPGIIVDATTQMFGISDPSYALVTEYPDHLLTRHLQSMTLFPGAVGIQSLPDNAYRVHEILRTLPRSWTETGALEGSIQFDPDSEERSGPITLGVALELEPLPNGMEDNEQGSTQRIAVIGDSDFLSNAFLGNGGNLDLGISLVRWLSKDDDYITIPAKTSPDTTLVLSETATGVIGLGFLFVFPGLFVGMGVGVWLRRRRR